MPAYKRGSIGLFFRGDPTLYRWYCFDGNLIDYTQNYNGSGTVAYFPGLFNQNTSWWDSDENKYITCAEKSDLSFTPKTFMIWFKCNGSKDSGSYKLFRKGDYGIAIGTDSTQNHKLLYQVCLSSDDSKKLYSANPVNDNRWHLVVCINTGSQLQMWLDRKLEATDTGGSEYSTNNKFPTIGRDPLSGYNSAFQGQIGEFAVFKRVISPQEISAYYKWATQTQRKTKYVPFSFTTAIQSIALQSLLEAYNYNTTALFTDLQRFGIDTTALQTTLEKSGMSPIAIQTTLDRGIIDTTALFTTLYRPKKVFPLDNLDKNLSILTSIRKP